tara:strand:- start:5296 stop:5463 length:168 start_codon:yes stop_codon:yes gene_type:complete
MPSYCFEDLQINSELSKNALKGVLSSLFQKNAIYEGEYPNGLTAYHLPQEVQNSL